eukprot:CAMPEP_0194062554 /NCGR_PEP_ID=MMETSP0009_2-20130614/77865_1 /TAXON_ID=210454 /ORGANISM="Grammatophora oceanica, Strain CCMP 410" /LENGTH=145 /DNA_ID=CAMNT_0038714327 /DNA_START=101 /DNA_END=536 /DNA_ORIENTATION=-
MTTWFEKRYDPDRMELLVLYHADANNDRLDLCMRHQDTHVSIEFSFQHSYPIALEDGLWSAFSIVAFFIAITGTIYCNGLVRGTAALRIHSNAKLRWKEARSLMAIGNVMEGAAVLERLEPVNILDRNAKRLFCDWLPTAGSAEA